MNRALLFFLVALLAVAACSGDDEPEVTENVVQLDEWSITGDLSVPAGTTIQLENTGSIRHNVVAGPPGSGQFLAASTNIDAGEEGSLDTTPLAPGTYEAWCTLPEHVAEGMVTTLVIS